MIWMHDKEIQQCLKVGYRRQHRMFDFIYMSTYNNIRIFFNYKLKKNRMLIIRTMKSSQITILKKKN